MANVETAQGIVLRTYPLTESSLIVHWLTPIHGRLATVAKGARNAKSVFRGKLDLFYLADFSFSRSRRSELHTLRELALRDTHQPIRGDLTLLQQACYCAALIETATETETPLPEIYKLLLGFLEQLGSAPPRAGAVFGFEIKLLRELGLEPDLTSTHLSEEAKRLFTLLGDEDWAGILPMRLASIQQRELKQFLHGFLIYHLNRLPKGREAAVAT